MVQKTREATEEKRTTYAEAVKGTCEELVSTLNSKIDALPKAERIMDLEAKMVKKIQEQQEAILSNAKGIKKVVESHEKEERECNVLVHNIPECEDKDYEKQKKHDLEKFNDIATALGATNVEVEKVIRLRRKTTEDNNRKNPRIMLLKLRSSEEVELIFKRRFNLKSHGYANTYISRDLSPLEREEQRKLRQELQEKGRDAYVIFRGKVVPRINRA